MNRRFVGTLMSIGLLLTGLLGAVFSEVEAQAGTIFFTSTPDQAALYLGDTAYVQDTLTIPAGLTAILELPANTVRDSLVITENGARVASYTLVADSGSAASSVSIYDAYSSFAPINGDGQPQPLRVTWMPSVDDAPREVTLGYLVQGVGWEPVYDMTILEEDGAYGLVQFGFDARLHNTALVLEAAAIKLVAGMPGSDSDYRPDMTITQSNVGYAEPSGAAVGGPVAINHVYDIGTQTLTQGDVLRVNLFYDSLDATRVLVWDARFGQRVDVIYQVANSSGLPFVEGPVRAYQAGLYVGQDSLEWTPSGSEGSVTVAGLSTIRVRRTESVEDIGTFNDSRYRHDVALSMTNHSEEALDLVVLDEWNQRGTSFEFSQEPRQQGNNVLRWSVTLPAGESLEITYTYIVD